MNSTSPLTPLPVGEGDAVVASPLPVGRRVKVRAKPALRLAAVYSILAALLYFALRNAPFIEIWNAVKQLKLWQIAILVIINITIYILITLRWWIIIRAERKTITFLPLVLVRVAVFGVSYFTLGPQIGGEALQILYLQRKYGMAAHSYHVDDSRCISYRCRVTRRLLSIWKPKVDAFHHRLRTNGRHVLSTLSTCVINGGWGFTRRGCWHGH